MYRKISLFIFLLFYPVVAFSMLQRYGARAHLFRPKCTIGVPQKKTPNGIDPVAEVKKKKEAKKKEYDAEYNTEVVALIADAFSKLPKNKRKLQPSETSLQEKKELSEKVSLRLPKVLRKSIMAFVDLPSFYFNRLEDTDEKMNVLACVIQKTPSLRPVSDVVELADEKASGFNAGKKIISTFINVGEEQKRAVEEAAPRFDNEVRAVTLVALDRLQNPQKKPYIVGICGVWSFRDESSALRCKLGNQHFTDNLDNYLALAYPDAHVRPSKPNEFICAFYSNGKKVWILNKKSINALKRMLHKQWQFCKKLNQKISFSPDDLTQYKSLPTFVQRRIRDNFEVAGMMTPKVSKSDDTWMHFSAGGLTGLAKILLGPALLYYGHNMIASGPRINHGRDAMRRGDAEEVELQNKKYGLSDLFAFSTGFLTISCFRAFLDVRFAGNNKK